MVGTLDSCGASVPKVRIALWALAAAVFLSTPDARGIEPTTASVSGTITAANLAQLGVTMTLTPQPYGISQTAMTDASGKYSFTALDPGCYTLQATSATFGSLMYGNTKAGTIFPDDTQILTLVAGQSKTGVDIDFAAGHSFSGTVSVTTGTPPSTVYVGLTDPRGRMSLVGKFQAAGPYSFTHVPPGDYLVYGYDATYPIKYSPRYALSYSFSAATKYSLSSSDVTGANLSLEPVPHIKGQVTKPGGGVAANSRVNVYFRGQTYGSLSGTADGSGNYDLSGSALYPTTQYRVGAFGTVANPFWGYEPDKMGGYTGDLNTAVAGDNTGHDVAAPAPGSVAGKVTEQGSATAISGVTVQLVDPVSVYRLGYNYYSATTDASGNFLILGIPYGRFQIRFTPANLSTDYHLGAGLEMFDVGSAVTGKNVSLRLGGKLAGTLSKESDGTPLSGASVSIYNSSCSYVASAYTMSDGTYLSPTLAAGPYRIFGNPPYQAPEVGVWFGGGNSCQTAGTKTVVASATATANIALPEGSGGGGFTASGVVWDSVTNNPIPYASVYLTNKTADSFFYGGTDGCGKYSISGLTAGAYDAQISTFGYRTTTFSNVFTISSANVTHDFLLTPLTGRVTGTVMSASKPVQGARVCFSVLFLCIQTDTAGFYSLEGLDTGTYKAIAITADGLEPRFFNNKGDFAGADSVSVTNGATTSGVNFTLSPVGTDSKEPDVIGTPIALTFQPTHDPEPALLVPNTPMSRVIADAEDVDWFRFTATAGKVYRVSVTGGGFTMFGPTRGVFDGVTKVADFTASGALFNAAGWTAPTTGERWLALSSSFSGGYTITLTQSDAGPAAPTVTGITPDSGPAAGGTAVTISGTGFTSPATLKIGGLAATNVVVVNATTITAKSPALASGLLYDVAVSVQASFVTVGGSGGTSSGTLAVPLTGTLTKGWLADFSDVNQGYLYHAAIEKIVRAGITTGCGGGKYCPSDPVTRDAMAKFLLVAKNGAAFSPAAATGTVFCDVTTQTLLAKWIEEMKTENITTGCDAGACGKPDYCPTGLVTRDAMSKFLLLAKNGSSFNPPAATGTVFDDVKANTFLAKWIEELFHENVTGGCGTANGKPTFCPTGVVSRGEMAKFLKVAFGL